MRVDVESVGPYRQRDANELVWGASRCSRADALGAGIALESIASGTLPLAIFGPERYPIVVGGIAMPQSRSPSGGAVDRRGLFETVGFDGALRTIVAAAICNVLLALVLFLLLRKRLVSR